MVVGLDSVGVEAGFIVMRVGKAIVARQAVRLWDDSEQDEPTTRPPEERFWPEDPISGGRPRLYPLPAGSQVLGWGRTQDEAWHAAYRRACVELGKANDRRREVENAMPSPARASYNRAQEDEI